MSATGAAPKESMINDAVAIVVFEILNSDEVHIGSGAQAGGRTLMDVCTMGISAYKTLLLSLCGCLFRYLFYSILISIRDYG